MKDSKSILLLVVSVLLIFVSFALLWSWGYNLGNQKGEKSGTVYIIKDSTATAKATRDSLSEVYSNTIQNLGMLDSTWVKADSLKEDLDLKLADFYRLRNEIATILKNPTSQKDLDLAKMKIAELQKKLDALRTRNSDIENENKRLYAALAQLTDAQKDEIQNLKNIPASYDTREATPVTSNSVLTASEIRLSALTTDEGKEQETTQALETEKFVGSFTVKNSQVQLNNAEIMVVLTQPDGKVVKNSPWESGSFNTREGRKIYSCKLRFEYNRGEAKRLSFTVSADRTMKGSYTVALYQNGVMIGKTTKTLV